MALFGEMCLKKHLGFESQARRHEVRDPGGCSQPLEQTCRWDNGAGSRGTFFLSMCTRLSTTCPPSRPPGEADRTRGPPFRHDHHLFPNFCAQPEASSWKQAPGNSFGQRTPAHRCDRVPWLLWVSFPPLTAQGWTDPSKKNILLKIQIFFNT